jgi:hypothetical protein
VWIDGDDAWATYVDEDGVEHWFDGLNLDPGEAARGAWAESAAEHKFASKQPKP